MEQTPRVLIVDDDEPIRKMLSLSFELDGFEVASASDGLEAIIQVGLFCPDVVVLDIMMPRMDGLTALGHLRRQPETRDLPVVLLSAKAESPDIAIGIRAGASDYVTKPFDAEDLLSRIRAVIAPTDDGTVRARPAARTARATSAARARVLRTNGGDTPAAAAAGQATLTPPEAPEGRFSSAAAAAASPPAVGPPPSPLFPSAQPPTTPADAETPPSLIPAADLPPVPAVGDAVRALAHRSTVGPLPAIPPPPQQLPAAPPPPPAHFTDPDIGPPPGYWRRMAATVLLVIILVGLAVVGLTGGLPQIHR